MHPDNRIREYRLKAGLSQGELGKKLGMHQTMVGNLENGKRTLSLDWARRVAKVFGISVADLLVDDDHPLRLEAEEQELIERYRAASDDQKENIRRVTEALVPFRHGRAA
jgi:transcriptional regulator with XRE-family HTH domain